jgi:hypothetical protein
MLQFLKRFLCYGLLAFGLQTSWAYSLLGPSAAYTATPLPTTFGDAWQVETIGFNPIPTDYGQPPYLGYDPLAIGPKGIGEEYRRNTPVVYYGFDQNFADFFGVDGEQAVVQAVDILNALTNVDSYSSNLVEFPLQSQSQNYRATTLEVRDLKSTTLALMMEQMGLADSIRYTWILHNRYHEPGAGLPPCPADMVYLVAMRNLDFVASPLNQLQYSDYVNDELYTYYIPLDLCDVSPPAEPSADAVELPADPLTKNPPVASGGEMAAGALRDGFFYTGLTRDDVAGLRYLYTSTNINVETAAPNSIPLSGGGLTTTNLNDKFLLTTSNLTALVLASLTNNPVALQTLYPGLVISSVVTNFNGTYTYTFGNVVYYTYFTNTTVLYQIQTTTIAPRLGAPAGSPLVTNTTAKSTPIVTNIVSGDFFLIPTNLCGLNVLSNSASIVTALTNFSGSFTNTPNSTTTVITSTNVVIVSTNHTLWVAPCEFVGGSTGTNSNTGKYEGIERIQFVRVADENIDPLTGNFVQPITNTYTMMVVPPNSSQATVQTFRRVLTQPDILFSAADLLPGPAAINTDVRPYSRNVTFNVNNILSQLAGPGTIDPPSKVTFNKVGPVIVNSSPSLLSEFAYNFPSFIWGSFDGSTNDPIVYPNGTSIATLESEVLLQISPATLPDATNAVFYSVALSVTGGQPPYTWMLTTNSPSLPTVLNLSPDGVISGTPNESGTFDFTVQMNDSSARSVQINYSITIH